MPLNLFDVPEKKLQEMMSESTPANNQYMECFNILLLRSHERLVAKTEALVRKTWYVAIATWAVALATIIAILVHP